MTTPNLILVLVRKLIIQAPETSPLVVGANGYRIHCGRMESLKLNGTRYFEIAGVSGLARNLATSCASK